MRRSHLEAFAPVCPRCLSESYRKHPVRLAAAWREAGDHVVEGVLHCTEPSCQMEYPIIDGIPLLVNNLRRFITDNYEHLMLRDDLGATMESLVGDAVGPTAAYNTTRQYLSSYTSDHYGDLDPNEPTESGVVACLRDGLSLLPAGGDGLSLDVGCSIGRSTFELARDGLALGIDLNVAMLRVAARVLRQGRVVYPRRRVGIVYERRDFTVQFESHDRVDFWCCDATAIPVSSPDVSRLVGMNVLDCVTSPLELLRQTAAVVRPGGHAVFATPYDWSAGATPVEAWIGGHSQRGPTGGLTEPLLTALLTPGAHPQSVPGLRIRGQKTAVPWKVRLHDRSTMQYDAHLIALDRLEGAM